MLEPVPGYRSSYLDVIALRSCLVALYLYWISNSRNLIPYFNLFLAHLLLPSFSSLTNFYPSFARSFL